MRCQSSLLLALVLSFLGIIHGSIFTNSHRVLISTNLVISQNLTIEGTVESPTLSAIDAKISNVKSIQRISQLVNYGRFKQLPPHGLTLIDYSQCTDLHGSRNQIFCWSSQSNVFIFDYLKWKYYLPGTAVGTVRYTGLPVRTRGTASYTKLNSGVEKVIIFGGQNAGAQNDMYWINVDDLIIYSGSPNWQQVSQSNTIPHRYLSGNMLYYKGYNWIYGGYPLSGDYLSDLQRFDPNTVSWSLMGNDAGKRYTLTLVGALDYVYILSGSLGPSGSNVISPTCWKYGPISGGATFTQIASMNIGRRGAAGAYYSVSNSIYVIFGRNIGGEYINSMERYDIASNTWTVVDASWLTNVPTIRQTVAWATNEEGLWFVGGGHSGSYNQDFHIVSMM